MVFLKNEGRGSFCSPFMPRAKVEIGVEAGRAMTFKLAGGRQRIEEPMVPWKIGHCTDTLLAGLLWERQSAKILLGNGCEKALTSEFLFVHCQQGLLLSVYVDDIRTAGQKHCLDRMWKRLM